MLHYKHMGNSFKDKVQLINYLIDKFGNEGVSVIKTMKLIFLAEVYSLRNYGTNLEKDTYWAMQNGPVPSEIKNITEGDCKYCGKEELKYIGEYIEAGTKDPSSIIKSINKPDDDFLSELKTDAVDEIFRIYGKHSENELIAITHKFNAWKKFEKKLSNNFKRVRMNLDDLFQNDGVLIVDESVLGGDGAEGYCVLFFVVLFDGCVSVYDC